MYQAKYRFLAHRRLGIPPPWRTLYYWSNQRFDHHTWFKYIPTGTYVYLEPSTLNPLLCAKSLNLVLLSKHIAFKYQSFSTRTLSNLFNQDIERAAEGSSMIRGGCSAAVMMCPRKPSNRDESERSTNENSNHEPALFLFSEGFRIRITPTRELSHSQIVLPDSVVEPSACFLHCVLSDINFPVTDMCSATQSEEGFEKMVCEIRSATMQATGARLDGVVGKVKSDVTLRFHENHS